MHLGIMRRPVEMASLRFWIAIWLMLCGPLGVGAVVRGNPSSKADSQTGLIASSPIHFPTVDGTDIRFSRVPEAAGWSQSRITSIVQDNQGFMWFGSQYGLDRYDGYTVRVFKNDPANSNSIAGTYIFALFKDRDGALWVSCFNSLDKLDPARETVTHYQIDPQHVSGPSAVVLHISQSHDGALWLSTANGLFRFDPTSGHSERFSHSPSNPRGLSSNEIKFTGEDRAGILWVAGTDGLDSFDPKSGTVTRHIALHEPRDLSFFEDSHGRFWIARASGNGVALLDRTTGRLTEYAYTDERLTRGPLTGVIALLEDQGGNLWLGTASDGILELDLEQRRFVRYRNHPGETESLSENRITTLYEDREGDIWAGLGASKPNFFPQHRPSFKAIPHRSDNSANLGERLVNAILEDSKGALWTGTTGGLVRFDRTTGESQVYQVPGHGSTSDVLSIVEDAKGLLWLATSGEGLYSLDSATGRLKSYRHVSGDAQSLSSDDVYRLFIDHSGTLWATTSNGLNRFDALHGKFTTFKIEGNAAYLAMAEDSDGLWIASYYGLLNFDPRTERLKPYWRSAPKSLVDERINSIYAAAPHSIWTGTQNGLTHLDTDTGVVKTYYEQDGLAGNAISCVLEDATHHLWMSTNHGVSRLDPLTGQFTNYSVADGLPGDDLTGWGACYRSASGELFFGGFAGGTAFYPQQVRDDFYVPPISLTEFEWSGADSHVPGDSPLHAPIGATREITLSHQQSTFSLGFSALSFRNPVANRYRYKLVGLDRDWHQVSSDRRLASYTTLGAGEYEFLVQGAAGRGPWSAAGASLRITVLPPWWQTLWCKGLLVLAVIVVCLAVYYYRIQQIAQQFSMRLDERIGERTRIARELHDSLLQGFQGLLLRLQAARNLLPGHTDQAIEALDAVLDKGDLAIAESRLALEDMRSSTSLSDDFAQTLMSLGEELIGAMLNDRVPNYEVIVSGRPRALDGIVRDEIYRIAREALRNAFFHSQARKVEAEVTFGDTTFVLRLRDDGVGIEKTVLVKGGRAGHWGLPGMRERAQSIGGRIEFWSEKDAGTEIELAIPGAIAYEKGSVKQHFLARRTPR